jgi:hypothetical protein
MAKPKGTNSTHKKLHVAISVNRKLRFFISSNMVYFSFHHMFFQSSNDRNDSQNRLVTNRISEVAENNKAGFLCVASFC